MKIETAAKLVSIVMPQFEALNDGLLDFQDSVTPEEFVQLRSSIGSIMAQMHGLLHPIFKEFPELCPEPIRDNYIAAKKPR